MPYILFLPLLDALSSDWGTRTRPLLCSRNNLTAGSRQQEAERKVAVVQIEGVGTCPFVLLSRRGGGGPGGSSLNKRLAVKGTQAATEPLPYSPRRCSSLQ